MDVDQANEEEYGIEPVDEVEEEEIPLVILDSLISPLNEQQTIQFCSIVKPLQLVDRKNFFEERIALGFRTIETILSNNLI